MSTPCPNPHPIATNCFQIAAIAASWRRHMETNARRNTSCVQVEPDSTAPSHVCGCATWKPDGKIENQVKSRGFSVFTYRFTMENCATFDFSLEVGKGRGRGIEIVSGIGRGREIGIVIEIGRGIVDRGSWMEDRCRAQASNYSGRLLTNLLLLCPFPALIFPCTARQSGDKSVWT